MPRRPRSHSKPPKRARLAAATVPAGAVKPASPVVTVKAAPAAPVPGTVKPAPAAVTTLPVQPALPAAAPPPSRPEVPAPPASAFAPLIVPAPPEPPPPEPPPVYQAPEKTPKPAAQLPQGSPEVAAVAPAVAALPQPDALAAERAKTVEELASMRQVTKAFCQATFFLNNWSMGKYVYGLTTTESIGLPPPTPERVDRATELMQPLVAKWVGKHVTVATLAAFVEIHMEHAGATAAVVVKLQEQKKRAAERAGAMPSTTPPADHPAAPAATVAPEAVAGAFGATGGARVQSIAPVVPA